MSASVLYMSMSLDGYIAGPNDEPDNPGSDGFDRLHEWIFTPGTYDVRPDGTAKEYTPHSGLTFADILVQRGWLDRFDGQVNGDTAALFDPVEPGFRQEYFDDLSPQEFSFACLLPELLAADLNRTARSFDVPVHIAVGRHDQNTPSELAVEYFDAIEAPVKKLHWFEKSAHMIPFEEPAKFNTLLADTVLGGG